MAICGNHFLIEAIFFEHSDLLRQYSKALEIESFLPEILLRLRVNIFQNMPVRSDFTNSAHEFVPYFF